MSDKGLAGGGAAAPAMTVPAVASFHLPIILSLSTCHLLNDMMQ